MRLKQLESHLCGVDGFECPSVDLEQIATNPYLAANILFSAHQRGDVILPLPFQYDNKILFKPLMYRLNQNLFVVLIYLSKRKSIQYIIHLFPQTLGLVRGFSQ